MNKDCVFQILRFVALFGLTAALYAGPIQQFVGGIKQEILSTTPDLAFLVILGGVVAFIGGFRMMGFIAALCGAFVLLFAQPLANWIQTL